jgi:hypothetical protein
MVRLEIPLATQLIRQFKPIPKLFKTSADKKADVCYAGAEGLEPPVFALEANGLPLTDAPVSPILNSYRFFSTHYPLSPKT